MAIKHKNEGVNKATPDKTSAVPKEEQLVEAVEQDEIFVQDTINSLLNKTSDLIRKYKLLEKKPTVTKVRKPSSIWNPIVR